MGKNATIAKTYDKQTAKFLAVVGENMPEISGTKMQRWIEDPKALQLALAKTFCSPSIQFKVWKTIKIGTGLKTADDFRRALDKNGFKTGDWALDLLGRPDFTAAAEETEIDLVKVKVLELGFKNDARLDQIYERAKELGLVLCPPEVGPQLRLQYKDQPNGEVIWVAMKPIVDSDGDPGVFYVGRGASGLWLDGRWGPPGRVWGPDDPWVFVRLRK